MKMIQLRCPNCDAILDFEDDIGTTCYCKFCGTRILLDEQQECIVDAKVRIKELEQERYNIDRKYEDRDKERKANKKTEKMFFFGAVGFFLVLFLCMAIFEWTAPKMIPVPYSSFDFCKMNYENAGEILHEAGFKNLHAQETEITGLFKENKRGKVKSISIDGDTVFLSGKEFSENAKIVIVYFDDF